MLIGVRCMGDSCVPSTVASAAISNWPAAALQRLKKMVQKKEKTIANLMKTLQRGPQMYVSPGLLRHTFELFKILFMYLLVQNWSKNAN